MFGKVGGGGGGFFGGGENSQSKELRILQKLTPNLQRIGSRSDAGGRTYSDTHKLENIKKVVL